MDDTPIALDRVLAELDEPTATEELSVIDLEIVETFGEQTRPFMRPLGPRPMWVNAEPTVSVAMPWLRGQVW